MSFGCFVGFIYIFVSSFYRPSSIYTLTALMGGHDLNEHSAYPNSTHDIQTPPPTPTLQPHMISIPHDIRILIPKAAQLIAHFLSLKDNYPPPSLNTVSTRVCGMCIRLSVCLIAPMLLFCQIGLCQDTYIRDPLPHSPFPAPILAPKSPKCLIPHKHYPDPRHYLELPLPSSSSTPQRSVSRCPRGEGG